MIKSYWIFRCWLAELFYGIAVTHKEDCFDSFCKVNEDKEYL